MWFSLLVLFMKFSMSQQAKKFVTSSGLSKAENLPKAEGLRPKSKLVTSSTNEKKTVDS